MKFTLIDKNEEVLAQLPLCIFGGASRGKILRGAPDASIDEAMRVAKSMKVELSPSIRDVLHSSSHAMFELTVTDKGGKKAQLASGRVDYQASGAGGQSLPLDPVAFLRHLVVLEVKIRTKRCVVEEVVTMPTESDIAEILDEVRSGWYSFTGGGMDGLTMSRTETAVFALKFINAQ